ncbi:MAG TPA: FxSxx-COOH system tetratricopeptide repeat protein [Ktedonobacteraceae bacterium]|nr:FxSxx-COOH system tetratricopeptide repeat protein [Ktedonobacteraceae bacterium]
MMDRVGQRFGNYRLLRLLGEGGFAEVYLGEHAFLGTQAAIKVLQMRLAQELLKDFLQEARTLAHLEHPHIVRVLDFGLEEGVPFLVLHYAPNGSLRQLHPRGSRLILPNIVRYTREIVAALSYIHEQKLIHRDVKPENMLVGRNNELLLGDFGVAVFSRNARDPRLHEASGTLAYMAPEQLCGEACTASDQYALAVVVYEWLCGSCPFSGTSAEIVQHHLHTPPPSLCEKAPDVPEAVEQVVLKALAKDPQQRFADVREFADALVSACSPIVQHFSHATASLAQTLPATAVPLSPARPSVSQDAIWSVPYRRNPFFTGREGELQHLYDALHGTSSGKAGFPQALSGLGGIGKSQTAVEYAFRHRSEYRAVLWARAETYETLLADYATIAQMLDLSEQREQQTPEWQREAVLHWLETQSDWLLVLDNVENLALVHAFLPVEVRGHNGHIVLTTRLQALGTLAQRIDLEKMEPDEGALFLLRRIQLIEQDATLEDADGADFIEAKDIARAMDGLPLALDQAGAYIEESGCSLDDYKEHYRQQRRTLLELRGSMLSEHPESVATTWLLSFQKLEQNIPAATELLRLCAFLHPDSILEEIITSGAAETGPLLAPVAANPVALDAAIAALRTFSLLRRDADTHTLSMHRLVQAVLKDGMDDAMQQCWAERAVRAVNCVFPDSEQVANWEQCRRCLPHVQVCVQYIEQWNLAFPEAARLLDAAGMYVLEQAHYTQAAYLLRKALDIRIKIQGSEHVDVAESLTNLAGVYLYQGKYATAEPLLTRALEVREQAQGSEHSDVAICLNNLALCYNQQGKYTQAEPLFQHALAIWERTEGGEHPDVARTLNNLALLYVARRQYAQAEPLYLRALAIWESIRGPVHPDVATCLNNLALLYQYQGKYVRAESIFQRVLAIREKTLGPEHPIIAFSLTYLARLYQKQYKYSRAEMLFKQALQMRKRALGPEHPDLALSLSDLARFYTMLGNYTEAESLFQQSLRIREQTLGPHHPDIALVLKHYAVLLAAQQRKDEARELLVRARSIREMVQ